MVAVNVGGEELVKEPVIEPVKEQVVRTEHRMYSSAPTRGDRLASAWTNRADEIIKAELGVDEYNKRLDKQNKIFEVRSWYIDR